MDRVFAGTGHRPPKLIVPGLGNGYHPAVYALLVDVVAGVLQRERPATVISGMALGFDQALAEAAIHCALPFTAAVPHRGQELVWPADSQRKYEWLLERAERVVVVSEGGYTAAKMQVRNEWMTRNGTEILACWDGGPEGGTANCIRYAQQLRRPIVNLWPEWQRAAAGRVTGGGRR